MRYSKAAKFAATSETVPVMIKILLNLRPGSSEEVRGQKAACAGYGGTSLWIMMPLSLPMMATTPASAIKNELRFQIDAQIETFGQQSRLTSSDLSEFQDRSEKIRMLCQELNRIDAKSVMGRRLEGAF
jgi:hypothetical protein